MRILIFAVLGAVLLEAVLLAWLLLSVAQFKNYWADRAKQSGEITYLALGDSAAQGIGASSPARGYVGLIAKQLEKQTGKKVRVINLSVSGATVRDCIREQIPQIANITADVVTVEIGANDVRAKDLTKFTSDFKELMPLLPDGAYVSNMPLFNSRPSSTQPAKDQTKVVNDLVEANKRLRLVDLQTQTEQHQSIFGFAPDLFHPNNLSYKNWYQAFWDQIQKDIK